MAENGGARINLGMHHYCVVVPNLEEAVTWYSEKLDFDRVERRFGFPEAGTEIAHVVNAGGIRIELIARDGSAAGPDADRDVFDALLVQGSKHIGFLVEDMGAAAEELGRRGVEFVVEPNVVEPNVVEPAGITNFWIRDPAGTLIEFDERLVR